MLGIRLSTSPSGLAPVSLYSDMLTAGGSFVDRQWLTSGASTGASNSISYGGGEVRLITGTSGRHCLCHFDCLRDKYPLYNNGLAYGASEEIVYGGYYGHGLYQKTGLGAGGGSGGWPPIFLTATNTQDANGWTRYRPTARQIEVGKTLSISLKLKLDRTGYTITTSNAIRIGLFQSAGNFVNYDNNGITNPVFFNYTGYMFGYGPANAKISKRTSSSALISSTTGVYTELASNSVSGFGGADEYDALISIKRIGSSIIELTSSMYASEYASKFTYTDNSPVTSFDTLAFYSTGNSVASLAISNPIAVYS